MPERLYLSYWIRHCTEANRLRHFERMLQAFPFSRLAPRATLRIYAMEYAEPPLLERHFAEPDVDQLLEAAREFQGADLGYEVEASWDLWQYEHDWKLAPARVILSCFGPEFESEEGENLRIEFAHDTDFLPQPGLPDNLYMARSNLRSLLHLAGELDEKLAVERRRLWSESGENFAQRLEECL